MTTAKLAVSGSYTLSGNMIAHDLDVQAGASFTANANDVRVYAFIQAGTYTMTSGNLYIEGSTATFANSNFVEGTGHVFIGNNSGSTYYGSGPTSVNVTSGVDFYDLTLNTNNGSTLTMGNGGGNYTVANDINLLNPGTAGGVITTQDAIIVSGNLNFQTSGNGLTLNLNDRLYRNTGTGTFTMGSAATNAINIYYTSSSFKAIYGFGSSNTYSGIVSYVGGGDMLVDAGNIANITVNNASARAILTGDVALSGDVTLTQGNLNAVSYTIDLSGNWAASSGTFTDGTSTVKFTGTAEQTLPRMEAHSMIFKL